MAYARASITFLRWCEAKDIGWLQEVHVAGCIKQLGRKMSPPPMLFDWLVTGRVMPPNPPHAVRKAASLAEQGVSGAAVDADIEPR